MRARVREADAKLDATRDAAAIDLATEENAVAQAGMQVEDARGAAHNARAGLAFARGGMQYAAEAGP